MQAGYARVFERDQIAALDWDGCERIAMLKRPSPTCGSVRRAAR